MKNFDALKSFLDLQREKDKPAKVLLTDLAQKHPDVVDHVAKELSRLSHREETRRMGKMLLGTCGAILVLLLANHVL